MDLPLNIEDINEEITEKFGSEEDWKEICPKFKKIENCNDYKPDDSGAWNFISKTLKYGIFVKNGASCIINILKRGGGDDKKGIKENSNIKKMADNALGAWEKFKVIFKEVGAFFAHIFSSGIWGILRAAWNLLELGWRIIKLVSDMTADFAFKVGKLVGLVIKIIKAVLVGRRRK